MSAATIEAKAATATGSEPSRSTTNGVIDSMEWPGPWGIERTSDAIDHRTMEDEHRNR
jgi:hypothetical protein